jgi:hypothetical protein
VGLEAVEDEFEVGVVMNVEMRVWCEPIAGLHLMVGIWLLILVLIWVLLLMQLGTCEIEYHLVGDENVAQELWVEGKVMEQVLESLKNKCFEGWVKDDKGFEVEFDFGDRGVEQEPQISLNVE